MAKEKEKQKASEIEKLATERVVDYFKMSTLLFGKNAPYDINELKEDSEFFKPAKELADELEIDWQKMTHEESNRIMLSLLDDYFNKINVDGDYSFTLTVTSKLKKKE